jgi:hypothetical protein
MAEARGRKVTDLRRVLREVRIAHAERSDVVADLRDAEQARLELLADALDDLAGELPPEDEQLLLGILPGQPPRFWVDATSFVMMARDKRTYQFAKDTRIGRTVIAEGADVEPIAEAVTRYVAERIVEREQAIEVDWIKSGARRRKRARALQVRPELRRVSPETASVIWGLAGFGLGMISGMLLLLAYAWVMTG